MRDPRPNSKAWRRRVGFDNIYKQPWKAPGAWFILQPQEEKGMKTRTIRPIDLKVGMYVIVEEWYHARGAAVGVPLKVVGLALPLMTVQYCPQPTVRGVMDTRQMRLTQVPLAYVRSLVPSFNPRKPVKTPAQLGITAHHVTAAIGHDVIEEK